MLLPFLQAYLQVLKNNVSQWEIVAFQIMKTDPTNMFNSFIPNIMRYTNIALPAYRYIPKLNLHPSLLKDIVHIPEIQISDEAFSEKSWSDSLYYLYAIDLFNYGYYWEVHEVLEKLWMKKGKNSPIGFFLQGLIQLSVALLKNMQSNPVGMKLLAKKALYKLNSQTGIYLGIDIDKLLEQFDAFIKSKQDYPPLILLISEKESI
jgi:predicted metal-dependent hydrolase